MQSAYERMPRVPGMQHNLLRDYPRTEPVSARYTDTVEEHAPSARFRRSPSAWRTSPTSSGRSHMIQKRRSPLARSFRRWTIPSEEVVPVHERQKLMAMLRSMTLCCTSCSCIWIRTPAVPTPCANGRRSRRCVRKRRPLYPAVRPDPTQTNRRKCSVGLDRGTVAWEKEAN